MQTNADEQNAAIEKFTADYSKQVAQLMGNFYNEVSGIKIALGRHTVHPDSFASVVVGTMFSSAEILQRSFGMMEHMNLLDDVYQLAKKELNCTGSKFSVNDLFDTINGETKKNREDTNYSIEIGI